MLLKSPAKLNLYLQVLNKRPDRYHNLNTLFERISLFDKISLKSRRDNIIKISCDNPEVPLDETNLCLKAAWLLQKEFGIRKGLDIKIIKQIPVGAGLGGGSGNAATMLIGLNKLWKLKLSRKKLADFGQRLGSDVSFFIYDTPFAIGRKRGEKIRILKQLKKIKLCHILVVPKIHVSTPLIYKQWDYALGKNTCLTELTKPRYDVKILTSVLAKKNLSLIESGHLFNSLEQVTIRLYPEVKRIKEKLAGLGLNKILMSGSGPAVFAIVSSGKEALSLSRKIKREERSWAVFAVSTR